VFSSQLLHLIWSYSVKGGMSAVIGCHKNVSDANSPRSCSEKKCDSTAKFVTCTACCSVLLRVRIPQRCNEYEFDRTVTSPMTLSGP